MTIESHIVLILILVALFLSLINNRDNQVETIGGFGNVGTTLSCSNIRQELALLRRRLSSLPSIANEQDIARLNTIIEQVQSIQDEANTILTYAQSFCGGLQVEAQAEAEAQEIVSTAQQIIDVI
jgi:predicted PurR-regulated permease PerM